MENEDLQGVKCNNQKWGEKAVVVWINHHWSIWEGKSTVYNSAHFKSALIKFPSRKPN